jgi:hypothetical protein
MALKNDQFQVKGELASSFAQGVLPRGSSSVRALGDRPTPSESDPNNKAWRFFGARQKLWSMVEVWPALPNKVVLKRLLTLDRSLVSVRGWQQAGPLAPRALRQRNITSADKIKAANGESPRLLVQPPVGQISIGACLGGPQGR